MGRYTLFYIICDVNDIDEKSKASFKNWVKEDELLFENEYLIVAERWKLIKGLKSIYGEDYEPEKHYREYNVYAQHMVKIVKALRSVYKTGYYQGSFGEGLKNVIIDAIKILR